MTNYREVETKQDKTICVRCKHCKRQRSGIFWMELFCGHPKVSPESQDYVTGEIVPYLRPCKNINRHGECKYFERCK